MSKIEQIARIKEVYAKGGNVIEYLKAAGTDASNSIEDILISYDLQAGSYIANYFKNKSFNEQYCRAFANVIDNLPECTSILEAGVGEATTLSTLVTQMKVQPRKVMGFDLSWSRLRFASEFVKFRGLSGVELFSGNLFEIPLKDNAVDIVYTSHSIEPNGGREEEAIKELFRVAGKYLVLLEPSYEFASTEGKARMERHGYVKDLHGAAKRAGCKVLEHRLFDFSANPLNPTGITVIEKMSLERNDPSLACPVTRTSLEKHDGAFYYSMESCLAYTEIDGIPCLLRENAILATHMHTDFRELINVGASFE